MIEKLKVNTSEDAKRTEDIRAKYLKIDKKSLKPADLLKRIEALEKLHGL